MPRAVQKILRELKKGLVNILGDQLKAVYLFGSFARGEGKLPDSDIDVMIVLNGEFSRQEVQKRSIELVSDLSLDYEVLISCKFTSEILYTKSKMPLMLNIKKDGVLI